jgi:hypothetical protein
VYFFDQGYFYSRVFSRMMDSLWGRKSLMVMEVPIGKGKTTFTQKFMAPVPKKSRIIRLDQPPDTGGEMLLLLQQRNCKSAINPPRYFVLRAI